jgi:hypothetical protein
MAAGKTLVIKRFEGSGGQSSVLFDNVMVFLSLRGGFCDEAISLGPEKTRDCFVKAFGFSSQRYSL